jgi:2-polyprenyl-3-methyl-5-hydroxy-6-metoxy-1,4-benzoquinol methylase
MMKSEDQKLLINEQILYYEARAHEYDEWFYRQGRYNRGDELNKKWFSEIEEIRQVIKNINPTGHILEIASGTGLWTEQLVKYADQITAIDAAPEMLKVNKGRLHSNKINYVLANIFDWEPKEQYSNIFFGFWLSHVPIDKFNPFWNLLKLVLEPNGSVIFVDSRYELTSTAKDHQLEGSEALSVIRRLNDGREFRIVKKFYEAMELKNRLRELGWDFLIRETQNYFIYGYGRPI